MNQQFETAWRLDRFFTERGIPYAIIGGFAVQRWDQPRFTRDVDVTILLPPGSEDATLREIVAAFPARVEDPVAFALEHRVLPLTVRGGSEADVSLGLPGYEEEAIARGMRMIWAAGEACGFAQRKTWSSTRCWRAARRIRSTSKVLWRARGRRSTLYASADG